MNRNTKKIKNALAFLLFVFPVLLLFLVFFVLPFLMGVFYSLTSWDGIDPVVRFVGLANFQALATEANYLEIVGFTLAFVGLNVILTLGFGFFLALSLEKATKSNVTFRVLFFLPNIISPLVAGFIWSFLFNSVIPAIGDFAGLPLRDISFLGDPGLALGSLVTVSFWQSLGYVMIIYIAGMNNLDQSVLESVMLEGAGTWSRIRFIIIPLIMPAITVNLFWLLSQSFRLFDLNVSLTNGGPGKTTTGMALDIYREGFGRNMMGLASAKALVLFLIVFLVTAVQLKATKSREVSA